ncbi:MAG: hypothetical protein AB1668_06080 [Nanoarchaeota archaeon]
MKARKKKRIGVDVKNRRLDLFLKNLEIEQEKREKIVSYVEDLTFKTLHEKSKPKLRLAK